MPSIPPKARLATITIAAARCLRRGELAAAAHRPAGRGGTADSSRIAANLPHVFLHDARPGRADAGADLGPGHARSAGRRDGFRSARRRHVRGDDLPAPGRAGRRHSTRNALDSVAPPPAGRCAAGASKARAWSSPWASSPSGPELVLPGRAVITARKARGLGGPRSGGEIARADAHDPPAFRLVDPLRRPSLRAWQQRALLLKVDQLPTIGGEFWPAGGAIAIALSIAWFLVAVISRSHERFL